MKCSELMKTNVKCVEIDDTVMDAAAIMKSAGVGFLPVCDANGLPLGVITDRDIVVRVVAEGRDPTTCTVAAAMSLETLSVGPDDDLAIAARRMATEHKSRILVRDEDGAVVGVISLSDLAQTEDADLGTLKKVSEREVRSNDDTHVHG
jgi:CBS domain-containing protein